MGHLEARPFLRRAQGCRSPGQISTSLAATGWPRARTPGEARRGAPSRVRARRPRVSLTKPFVSGSFFKLTHYRPLTYGTEREQCSSYVLDQEVDMLKTFVEEAAALASITLFVGMIAVWAQLIPQL